MPQVNVHVDGDPKPQPKKMAFARRMPNGKIFSKIYDTGGANGWKALIADAMMPHRPAEPLESPVEVHLRFQIRRPERLMGKKIPDGELPHLGKIDVDNLTKAVFDTLTQMGMWRDDGQVQSLLVEKCYAPKLGRPGMDLTVFW